MPIAVDEEVKQIFREAHRASMSPRPENRGACVDDLVPPSLDTRIAVPEPIKTKPHVAVDASVETSINDHDQCQNDESQTLHVETQSDDDSPTADAVNVTGVPHDHHSVVTTDDHRTTTAEKCATTSQVEDTPNSRVTDIHDVIINPSVMRVDHIAQSAASRSVIACEIRDNRRVYVLPVGPDELPGLRAWTLVCFMMLVMHFLTYIGTC